MINAFEDMLTGGHPNSLGRTVEVVNVILKDKSKLEDLYQCYFSEDEIVRMRVSNAFKRVCKEKPRWVIEYADRFISEISKIDQPSAQWTFAQLMMLLDTKLSAVQRKKVIKILQKNLETSDDWIVLNFTMEALTKYARGDADIRTWLLPRLKKLRGDTRKSVARRAEKFTGALEQ